MSIESIERQSAHTGAVEKAIEPKQEADGPLPRHALFGSLKFMDSGYSDDWFYRCQTPRGQMIGFAGNTDVFGMARIARKRFPDLSLILSAERPHKNIPSYCRVLLIQLVRLSIDCLDRHRKRLSSYLAANNLAVPTIKGLVRFPRWKWVNLDLHDMRSVDENVLLGSDGLNHNGKFLPNSPSDGTRADETKQKSNSDASSGLPYADSSQ